MPSAKDKQLRKERILKFIRENRDATPPTGLQSPRKEEGSLRQKKRVTFIHGKQQRSLGELVKAKENEKLVGQGLTSCLITKSSDTRIPAGGSNIPAERIERKLSRSGSDCLVNPCLNRRPSDYRVRGGENDPSVRNVGKLPRTDSECQFKSPGLHFLKTQHSELAAQEVRLTPVKPIRKELKNKCDFFPRYVDNRPIKDQTTQTLYRESSAQTLAYLPEIVNKETAETLELFSLPRILPNDKPPGLQEVEILERARKRWLFNEAMKTNFKRLLTAARNVAIKTELKAILEAFEWEQWMEREEYIQECQMMRLQIVIKMFDKREREMHAASKIRVEQACERIEKRRQAGLRKNEIEFQRGMRRLNIQLAKTSRKWVKQTPMHALGSPCSEFYGPMLRHGVDPARRSFESTTGRRAFDMRIDDLEKRVNMRNVQCSFSKLKEWSKPKEYVREYEQNFCNDGNLQKLYESLKFLRTQATHVKPFPDCLKIRLNLQNRERASSIGSFNIGNKQYFRYMTYEPEPKPFKKHITLVDPHAPKKPRSESKGHEDLEHLIHTYEGTYIGTIMQFLADEMQRLKEQRKLHFFSILAQKELWKREAGEAGLRQEENDMRMLYEEIFHHSNTCHHETSQEYIDTVMTKDIDHVMEHEAVQTVTEMARQIDQDIQRWLESFKLIQNPLTYVPLRVMLRDMVSPDLNEMLRCHENSLIVQYIVEDVIFGRLWEELEPFDIATTLTSDWIDRLIDNDLYLFSTDSESESPQKTSWYEVQAIIRKLIRQAVPGRRWKEETERIVTEAYNDLFDDVFAEIFNKMENPVAVQLSDLKTHCPNSSRYNFCQQNSTAKSISPSESVVNTSLMGVQLLSLIKKFKEDKVTKELNTDEKLKIISGSSEIFDTFIASRVLSKSPKVPVIDVKLTEKKNVDIVVEADNQEPKVYEFSSDEQYDDIADVEPIDVKRVTISSVELTEPKDNEQEPEESDTVILLDEASMGEEVDESEKTVTLYSEKDSIIFKFR